MTVLSRPLSAEETFRNFLRIPEPGTRALVPLVLHPPQRQLIEAWDAVGPDGLPRYAELAAIWLKKLGKSTMDGGFGIAELVGGREPDREVIVLASDWTQARDVPFAAAARFVKRHPWLTSHVRVLASELVYKETVTDHRTGGRHTEEHILRAVPARDARSLHGSNPTLTVIDELWTFDDYSAIEALARSPARKWPRLLYSTYCGLRSQMHEGYPLWDLWRRWKSGTDKELFVSYVGGPDGWRVAPWITERFLDQQRRQFAAVPSKFKRLWMNEWATGDEAAFLTDLEVSDATDHALIEPPRGIPGVSYALGVDLGISYDWTAVVVTHVDLGSFKLVVDAVRFWRGTTQHPVNLMEVEAEILELQERFSFDAIEMDAWNARLLADRLLAQGVPNVRTVPMDPTRLDMLATRLKGWFSSRRIRIPNHPELIEQLETIEGEETRRRDRIRFTSGHGQGAGRHDDIAMALCLSAASHGRTVGMARLPEGFRKCWRAVNVQGFHASACFLLKQGGLYLPTGNDPACQVCPGWQSVREARRAHGELTGEWLDHRSFYTTRMLPNHWVGMEQLRLMAKQIF